MPKCQVSFSNLELDVNNNTLTIEMDVTHRIRNRTIIKSAILGSMRDAAACSRMQQLSMAVAVHDSLANAAIDQARDRVSHNPRFIVRKRIASKSLL